MTTSTPPTPWPVLPPPISTRYEPQAAELGLVAEAGKVSWCRTRAAEILGEWKVERPVINDAVLILSELVSNSVVHGDGTETIYVRLELDRWQGTLVGTVTDSGRGWPAPRESGEMDEGGRGLMLVDMLSTKWGVTREADGQHKTAWFCLRAAPSACPNALA